VAAVGGQQDANAAGLALAVLLQGADDLAERARGRDVVEGVTGREMPDDRVVPTLPSLTNRSAPNWARVASSPSSMTAMRVVRDRSEGFMSSDRSSDVAPTTIMTRPPD
jgi:hypothetical protein